MNDELFGLPLAPFSAVPDVNLFVETPEACEAIHLLTRSLLRDDGIAVLTGEVGVGKTMISKVLADRLSHKLRPLVLSSANFPTRRALYQSVLFSLGQDFVGLTEQEARLLVLESSREQLSKRGNLVLIIDEAHLLTDRLLEELRSLISNVDEGRLLVQIVLIGHTSLKDRLRESKFIDLQHRIGCFAHINPMSVDESTDYIRWRLELAGKDAFDVVTPGALQLITEIANGYPRCINILCDRAIGLAVESSSPIVDELLVRMALTELRQLPLVWNEPRGSEPVSTDIADDGIQSPIDADVDESEHGREAIRILQPVLAEPATLDVPAAATLAEDLSPSEEWAAFEIGADWSGESELSALDQREVPKESGVQLVKSAGAFEEIPVLDPYARLDVERQALLKFDVQNLVTASASDSQAANRPVEPDKVVKVQQVATPVDDSQNRSRSLSVVDFDQVVDDLEDEAPDASWIEEFVDESWPEVSVLEAIHELRAGIQRSSTEESTPSDSKSTFSQADKVKPAAIALNEAAAPLDELEIEYDVVEPELMHSEVNEVVDQSTNEVAANDAAVPEVDPVSLTVDNDATVTHPDVPSTDSRPEPASRFGGLFTRLRRKRQAIAADSRIDD